MREAYNYTCDIHEDAINTYYRRRNRQKRAYRKMLKKQRYFGIAMIIFGIFAAFSTGVGEYLFFFLGGIGVATTKEIVL